MKKSRGILFTIIVLILLIIVVGVYYVGFNKNQNKENVSNENRTSKETNVVEETKNEIDNEIDVEDEEELKIGITNKEKTELEEKAKEVLTEYLPLSFYQADNLGAMPYILVELKLIDSEDLDELLQTADVEPKDYIKTTVKYDAFKNAMLEYLSEEYFNKYFKLYKNMDGFVGVQNTGAGLGATEVESAELLDIQDDEYMFRIIFKDVEVYEHYLSGSTYIKENDWLFYDDVTFKYENDKFVISEYSDYTPYIEGTYVFEASDAGYEFCADGTVEYYSSMIVDKGTYKAVDKDTFEIVFTDRISYEEDYDNTYIDENGYEITPLKEVESKIEEVEKIIVVNEEKLTVEYEVNGQSRKGELVKY